MPLPTIRVLTVRTLSFQFLLYMCIHFLKVSTLLIPIGKDFRATQVGLMIEEITDSGDDIEQAIERSSNQLLFTNIPVENFVHCKPSERTQRIYMAVSWTYTNRLSQPSLQSNKISLLNARLSSLHPLSSLLPPCLVFSSPQGWPFEPFSPVWGNKSKQIALSSQEFWLVHCLSWPLL